VLTRNINVFNLKCILILLLWQFANIACANQANLVLTTTSVMLDKNSRHTSVHIVNQGQRTGVFEINWLDHTMNEQGELVAWKPPLKSPWSIQPYIRYSPRRVTLGPGESQLIKVALKAQARQAEKGEYFSHLKVITINNNVEETLLLAKRGNNRVNKENDSTINIKSLLGISIPVIWRHDVPSPKAKLTLKEIDTTNNSLLLTINRQGLSSTRGFLHIFQDADNKDFMLPVPVVIYPNVAHREIRLSLPIEYPANGNFDIIYSDAKDNTDTLIGSLSIQH
jgi:fimbrial chaperone protein